MRVIGIITARGGSKGIPRKNLSQLAGKPLLAYTTEAALSSRRLTRTIISTDDAEIADVASTLGVECPFVRPTELAQDQTPTLPVLQDAVRRLESMGEFYDAIFTLQPTNPLRLASDIDGAIDLLERTGAESVIGFSEVGERHPARMKLIRENGQVVDPDFGESFEGQRRQDLPKLFLRNGSVYLTRRATLIDQNSIKGTDCRAWLIPPQRAINIDEPFDLFLAEKLMGLGVENFRGRPGP